MKYGVREICDVVLKAKGTQRVGNKIFYKNEPVIYFDTLKTSTLEGASAAVYAQGGRGNARLVAWEGDKTVTFTMEDALISPEGFMILTGAGLIEASANTTLKQHITERLDFVNGGIEGDKSFVKYTPSTTYTVTDVKLTYDTDDAETIDVDKMPWKDIYASKYFVGVTVDTTTTYSLATKTTWVGTNKYCPITKVEPVTEDDKATEGTGYKAGVVAYSKSIEESEEDTIYNYKLYLDKEPYFGDINEDLMYVMFVKEDEIISEPFIPVHTPSEKTEKGWEVVLAEEHINYNKKAKDYTDGNYTADFNSNTNYTGFDSVIVDYYTEVDSNGFQVDITPDSFGGNFYLEASTLFRNQQGVDMPAEFIIPNCKIQSNFTFTMAATGDPSTFTFTMDAFPDYTRFDKTKKVFAALQVVQNREEAAYGTYRKATKANEI